MGLMDTTKMIQKARQAKKRMEQLEVAGQSGSLALLMNGLYEVTEVEVSEDKLKEEIQLELSEKDLKKIADVIKKNVKEGLKDAKKQLEKQMSSQTSLDDLKDLLN